MPYELTWKLDVEVPNALKLPGTTVKLPIDAYDPIEVVIPKDTMGQEVIVEPGVAGYPVRFLMTRCIAYQVDGDKRTLAYSINAKADEKDRITLDAQQVFIGAGAASRLNDATGTPPKSLFFYNKLDVDVTITILVGRKATKVHSA